MVSAYITLQNGSIPCVVDEARVCTGAKVFLALGLDTGIQVRGSPLVEEGIPFLDFVLHYFSSLLDGECKGGDGSQKGAEYERITHIGDFEQMSRCSMDEKPTDIKEGRYRGILIPVIVYSE